MRADQAFHERFAQAWADPGPESLVALLHEDVVLRQPHLPAIHGRAAAHAEFQRLFRWLPGLRSEVACAREDAAVCFIEHALVIPVGARELRLPCVDRFLLHEGLARERMVYFDVLRLARLVLCHPRLWPGLLRYRAGFRPR